MSATEVHVAVIELDEYMDPVLFANRDLGALHTELREYIEGMVLDDIVPEWNLPLREFLAECRGDGSSWESWHSIMHEIDGAPWVTITTKEI